MTNLTNTAWLQETALQQILKLLEQTDHEARVVGGAVRNALLDAPIDDIDIATTRLPQDTTAHLKANGIKVIPTGIDHGTVTAVLDGKPFEITTLRADIDHDGRHATVQFSTDWAGDAKRRDFTINAISVDRNGTLFDYENGLEDIKTRRVRFIGDPDKRIEEDHLRILRFFRIYAHYGEGQPDPEALKACTRAKASIAKLSSERIWSECKKLLSAKDVGKVLNWMRVTGVLSSVLPESEKWGITAIPHLMTAEKAYDWPCDPYLRLMAIIPPQLERISTLIERLKLSNNEVKRLQEWVHIQGLPFEVSADNADTKALAKTLYHNKNQAICDYYKLEITRKMNAGEDGLEGLALGVNFIENWQRPQFPISGKDLIERGFNAGAELGKVLKNLEKHWVEHDFTPTQAELLALVQN